MLVVFYFYPASSCYSVYILVPQKFLKTITTLKKQCVTADKDGSVDAPQTCYYMELNSDAFRVLTALCFFGLAAGVAVYGFQVGAGAGDGGGGVGRLWFSCWCWCWCWGYLVVLALTLVLTSAAAFRSWLCTTAAAAGLAFLAVLVQQARLRVFLLLGASCLIFFFSLPSWKAAAIGA